MSAATDTSIAPHAAARRRKQSYWRIVLRQYRRNVLGIAAFVLLVLFGAVALFAPFIAAGAPFYLVMDGKTYVFPNLLDYDDLRGFQFDRWQPGENDVALWPPVPFDPDRSDLRNRLAPPDRVHWLGTDDRGRDVLSRLVWGTRVSISIGFVAVGISLAIGVVLGSIAGYYGGVIDSIILRLIEIVLTFPTFFLILAVIAFLPPSIYSIMIVIGLLGWTGIARLVRGEFLKLRDSDFCTAARASGLSDARIIFRHLLPNALTPVWVSATFGVAGAILVESSLSFLGFGPPPPTPSWGEILAQSQSYLHRGAWWLVVYPGLAIFVTVTAFNLVGEGLRDAMDPRLRQ